MDSVPTIKVLVFGTLPILAFAVHTRGGVRQVRQLHRQTPEWEVVSNPRFPNRTEGGPGTVPLKAPTRAPVATALPASPPPTTPPPAAPRDLENDVVVNETRVKVDETSDKRKNMTEKVPVLVEPPDKCPMGGLHPDIELLVRNMKSGSPVRVSRSAPKDYAGKTHKGSHYVFITGMPYSGTTALYGLLSTSPHASNLCSGLGQCCEGGPLLLNAGLIPPNIPMDPRFPKDWDKAITVFQGYWNLSKPVLVEKSVSNLDRFPQIWATLKKEGARVSFLYLARSKCFYNHPELWYTWKEELKGAFEMAEVLRKDGAGFHVVKYEDMVSDPYSFSRQILDVIPELESLDPMFNGLHSAPYVNQSKWATGQGDYRGLSVASYVYLKRFFLTQFPGLAITQSEGFFMMKSGYTKQYFAEKPFATGYLTSGAPMFNS